MIKRKHFIDGVSKAQTRSRLDDYANRPKLSEQASLTKSTSVTSGKFHGGVRGSGIIDPLTGRSSTTIGLQETSKEVLPVTIPSPNKKKGLFTKIMLRRKHKSEKEFGKRHKSKFRRILKRSLIAGSVLAIGFSALVALKAWTTFSNVIDRKGAGSPALGGAVSPSELTGEGDGRVNIMLLGVGDVSHTAHNLADTILVVSIDPIAKTAGLLSIPRDLYVTIPSYDFKDGKGTIFFGSSKINATHVYGEARQVGGGAKLMAATLKETLGIPIHYYAKVDFTGFRKAVQAVGGIDITLKERVYDPIFNREYGSHALDIGPGKVHLNGLQALLLSRARGSTGGIGLARSDFDRTEHQRTMLIALKEKALSLGTYKNPTKIFSLLDALGSHVRTDLQLGDMLRLRDIAEEIPIDHIVSYGLDNSADNYLKSANIGGASAQVPKTGNFEAIKKFVRSIFVDGFLLQEKAYIDVLNGSTQAGLAISKANDLRSFGYYIRKTGNAPSKDYTKTILYDMKGNNPLTKKYLENRFHINAKPATELPVKITTKSDFVLIFGSNAIEKTTN